MAKWFNTSLDATESWDEQDLKHAYFCSPYWWIRVKLQPLCLCKGPFINYVMHLGGGEGGSNCIKKCHSGGGGVVRSFT